jgi:predicted metalloprotease
LPLVAFVRFSLLAAILALALAVLAGCGDEDAPATTPVALNEPGGVDLDEADAEATKVPEGVGVLDEFQELRQAEGSASVPAIRGSAGLAVPDWMHAVDGDVASYWQQQFNNAGYEYSPATENIFDTRAQSACGTASPRTGPFYCTTDEGIYLPVAFFTRFAGPYGDAGVAVVIAHENAHRVQDLLGLFDQPISSAQLELQADCLAGVWAKSIYDRGLLEEGDIGEILGLVNISGDSPETPIDAPGAHGSSALRQDFFAQGYDGGAPGSCPVPKPRQIAGGAGA